jgi:hypothetical protein
MIEAVRRNEPVRCPICNRTVKRKSRQQIYCSPKCMRKGNYVRKAGLGQLVGQDTALVPNPPKKSNENNILQWPKTGSSISANGPINLLGGGSWKWPVRGKLDSTTISKIRWCEIGGELMGPPE